MPNQKRISTITMPRGAPTQRFACLLNEMILLGQFDHATSMKSRDNLKKCISPLSEDLWTLKLAGLNFRMDIQHENA